MNQYLLHKFVKATVTRDWEGLKVVSIDRSLKAGIAGAHF